MSGHLAVGNDVVHLADPAIASHHEWARFVDRVCTDEERLWVRAAADGRRLLWSLFAAKEAAYKAAVKLCGDTVFAPRRFAVDPARARVRHGDLVLFLSLDHGDEWVHAVAGTQLVVPVRAVARRPSLQAESAAARDLARREIAAHFGLPLAALAIDRPADARARDGLGPPRLTCGGRLLPVDVSLSHDGPFVACAAAGQAGPAAS